MKLLLPFALMAAVVLGCAKPQASTSKKLEPPPSKSGPLVANMAVKDPKARFLGEAITYLSNLHDADLAMAEEFVNESRTPQSIIGSIKQAHEQEKKDFGNIEIPAKAYGSIASKLLKIHKDHEMAWTLYANVFLTRNTSAMEKILDKATAIIKVTAGEMNDTGSVINAELKQLDQ